MTLLFVDTFYWIALLNPNDTFHQTAIHQDLSNSTLVTTEAILDELLNFFSSRGSQLRRKAHTLTQRIAADPAIVVIAQDPNLRKAALDLYLHRPDKGYSFTDCLSMIIMRQMDITQVLTHDHHFTQEGFTILL